MVAALQKFESKDRAVEIRNWLADLIARSRDIDEEYEYRDALDNVFCNNKNAGLEKVPWRWERTSKQRRRIKKMDTIDYGDIDNRPEIKTKLTTKPGRSKPIHPDIFSKRPPFSWRNRISKTTCVAGGPPAYFSAYKGTLSRYTCGRSAWLPIGGGAIKWDSKTGEQTLLFDTRRFPGTNLLETGHLIYPETIAQSKTGYIFINAKYGQTQNKRYLFHQAPNSKDWRRGRNSTPDYAVLTDLVSTPSGILLSKRCRYSNVTARSIAMLDPNGSDKVELLYRSHDDIDESLKVFPEEPTSRWAEALGYPPPPFAWRDDKPKLAAFFKRGRLGLEQEDGSIIWHRTDLPQSVKTDKDDYTIKAVKGGYLIFKRSKEAYYLPNPEL